MTISFAKVTSEAYAGLTPVTDRIYYITDTREIYLNGVKYGGGDQAQADWDQSDSTAVDYIKDKPALAPVATLGTYNSLAGKPAIPNFTGGWFGIWHDQTDSASTTVTLSVSGTNARANTFQYCTNVNSNNWVDYTLGTALTLGQYQYVLWRNKDAAKLLGNPTGHYVFTITGGGVYLSGNIMSLKDKGMQYNDFCSAYDFYQMFKDCVTIKDASMLELPAAVGQYLSYAEMFKGCTGLVHAPRRICIANHIGNSGCQSMFEGCTSLVDAPEIECATLSANFTYAKMFYGCTSLKSAPPVLPARVTHGYDYDAMFGECTSLEEAPVIMATTMATGCLRDMFYKCTSLKTVEIACPSLGANVSPGWLSSDIQAGLLKCPSSVDLSTRGPDTVQAAWTVVRTDQPQADWDQSDSTEASYIRNKPAIPEPGEQVQSDWDESDSTSPAYILNKEEVDGTVDGVDAFADGMNAYFYGLHKPLTMAIADNSYSNGIRFYRTNTAYEWDLQWSADGGRTWTSFVWTDNTTDTVTIGSGGVADYIMLRGNNPGLSGHGYCYLNTTSRNDANTVVNASGHFNSVLRRERYWMIDDLSTITDSSQGYVAYGFFSDNYTDTRTYWSCNLGDCSGLILGAKKLTQNAYGYMFTKSPMTKGPQILATDFAYWSCYAMISGGTNLSEIYVDFTTWPGNDALTNWLSGAAASGVFKCPATLDTSVARSSSTIPANWTIETH